MDSVKEVTSSIIDSLRDRFGNPLLGAFVLSWLVWNFRLVLILFGDGVGGWQAKLDFIDKRLMTGAFDWQIHGVVAPFVAACLWVFAFPFVTRRVLVFHKSQIIATKRAILIAEENNPISDKEATRIRLRMKNMSDLWNDERKLYLQTVEDLQDQLKGVPVEILMTPDEIIHSSDNPNVVEDGAPSEVDESAFDAQSLPLREADLDVDRHSNEPLPVGLIYSSDLNNSVESDSYVDFRGHAISWPWHFRAGQQLDLSSTLRKVIGSNAFTEQSLLVLFASRNQNRFDPEMIEISLRLDKFSIQVGLDELVSANLVSGPHPKGSYSINSQGRMFLAWLMRKGFRFIVNVPK